MIKILITNEDLMKIQREKFNTYMNSEDSDELLYVITVSQVMNYYIENYNKYNKYLDINKLIYFTVLFENYEFSKDELEMCDYDSEFDCDQLSKCLIHYLEKFGIDVFLELVSNTTESIEFKNFIKESINLLIL